jgi:peptide/nickel transport system substrate-binding protein
MLVTGSIGDASVLLPILASDASSFEITGMIYNGLVKYDKNIKTVGDLAESWTISDDKLSITFKLRKGVKWHDGAPFTAKDVEYTYKAFIDPKTPTSYARDFLMIKDFQVIDDYTVKVTYEKPYAPALESWGQSILPSHLLEGKDLTKSPLRRKPIGTGPYKFKEWKTQEKIIVEANPEYFEGRPYIQRHLTRVIPDLATMFLELKAERIDQMPLTPLQYRRQTNSEWWDKNFNKYQYLSFQYTYLGYNLNDWRFKDKLVRQALTTAINRESVVQGVLLGLGQVINAPYKPDTYWYNDDIRKYPYDPEKAKKMLAQAGWKDTDGDGVLDKDGKPFKFTILTNQGNPQRKKAATIIQRDLKKVGIQTEIRVVEWAAFLKNFIDERKFEAIVMGWSIGVGPDQYVIWHSSQTKKHQLNFISYSNPEVDRLLEEGVSTYDRAERKKFYDKFQEHIAEDQPYTFLYAPKSLPIISSRVQGIKPAPIGISYNYIKWYVPKQLQKYEIAP